jgi:hypothetical protein
VVLLAVAVLQRRTVLRDAARVAAGGVVGGALVVLTALAYIAWSGVALSVAWTAVFGFRGTALGVIVGHSTQAPMHRAIELVLLALLTGILSLVAVLGIEAVRHRLTGRPVAWAVAVTLVFETVSIASGGSYWPHYLIQLAPMLALAAGLWAPHARRVRAAVAFVAASAIAATFVTVLSGASSRHTDAVVGTWLHDSRRQGDTATVLYGNAAVQQGSGMVSPYPQLWTLPMRTLDPHLTTLRSVLRGPSAPTWVVVTHKNLDTWRIDPNGRTRKVLAAHYHDVAQVCGRQVYLHDGVHRALAPTACRSGSELVDLDIDVP